MSPTIVTNIDLAPNFRQKRLLNINFFKYVLSKEDLVWPEKLKGVILDFDQNRPILQNLQIFTTWSKIQSDFFVKTINPPKRAWAIDYFYRAPWLGPKSRRLRLFSRDCIEYYLSYANQNLNNFKTGLCFWPSHILLHSSTDNIHAFRLRSIVRIIYYKSFITSFTSWACCCLTIDEIRWKRRRQ